MISTGQRLCPKGASVSSGGPIFVIPIVPIECTLERVREEEGVRELERGRVRKRSALELEISRELLFVVEEEDRSPKHSGNFEMEPKTEF